jgi:hypothetical protein
MRSLSYHPLDADSASAAGSHDDTKHKAKPLHCTGSTFGQGETVGIVAHTYRFADQPLDIGLQRVPDQARGVGILD